MADADIPLDMSLNGGAPNITMNTSGTPEVNRNSKVSWQQSWRRWQRMGCNIKVQLPYVGTGRAIFGIEIRPDIFTQPLSTAYNNPEDATAAAVRHPVWLFGEGVSGVPTKLYPLRGAAVYQFEAEPPLSRMSRLCRAWSGSIYVSIRTVSNFTCQGDFNIARLDGVDFKKSSYVNGLGQAAPPIFGDQQPNLSLHDAHVLGYTRVDLSEKKHVAIALPYFRLFTYQDRALAEIPSRDLVNTKQMLLFALEGTANSNQTAQVQFNLEYCPGPDFMFHLPMYPFYFKPDGHQVYHFRDPQFATYYFGDPNLIDVTWRRARNSNSPNFYVVEPYDDPFLEWYAIPPLTMRFEENSQGWQRQLAYRAKEKRDIEARIDLAKSLYDLDLLEPPSP